MKSLSIGIKAPIKNNLVFSFFSFLVVILLGVINSEIMAVMFSGMLFYYVSVAYLLVVRFINGKKLINSTYFLCNRSDFMYNTCIHTSVFIALSWY